MPNIHTALPLGPDTTWTTPGQDSQSWAGSAWAWITEQAGSAPGWVWMTALAALTIGTTISLPILRSQALKAGARTAGKTSASARKDRRLLAAALTPAVLFWLAVLFGSGRGLVAFGRDDLHWTDGWEYLVPFTLDGVAVSFGFLAFRAVAKQRNPDRAYRIVWMATLASAGINFIHEIGGSILGAGYLAILSLFGMLIFHEFLAQFEEGTQWIKRDNPKFGMRWLTWPTNTVCAWFAWRNYPPAADVEVTIRGAVKHLETVRADKALKAAEKVDTPAWWMTFTPWIRTAQLRTALDQHRAIIAAGRTQLATDIERLTAEHNALVTDLTTRFERDINEVRERAAEEVRNAATERGNVETSTAEEIRNAERKAADATAEVARLNAAHADTLQRLNAEHNAALRNAEERLNVELARQRAELSTTDINTYRSAAPKKPSVKASTGGSNQPALSDEEAVQAMFNAQPNPGFEWSQNAVRKLTGAGWTRIPNLINAWRVEALNASGEPGVVNQ